MLSMVLRDLGKAIGHRQYLRSLRGLAEFLAFAIIGLHGWPLVFKIPHTLRVLFDAFRPGGHGIPDADFWAFSRVDATFRPWYNKIARDYRAQGRFGYAWDDGLGMALGSRFYGNWVTYSLLGLLGTRKMCALGYILMVLAAGLIAGSNFGVVVGIMVAFLAAGSPLIVGAYTHLGKPEVFWWSFALMIAWAGFLGHPILAGLMWSFLAFVNLAASMLFFIIVGPALFAQNIFSGSWIELSLAALPGIAKHGVRLISALRSGFVSQTVSTQSRLCKRPWYPTPPDLIWWLPLILSISASAYTSRRFIVGELILVAVIGLYWANFRIIYLNDPQSFHLAFWVIGLSYAAVTGSFIGLLAILLLAYNRPVYCGIPGTVDDLSRGNLWQRRLHSAWEQIKAYPAVTVLDLPKPAALTTFFFDRLPDGARVIVESRGDLRTDFQFRAFWQWTEEFLPSRQVDLANEIYTAIVEPELADRYLSHFNAEKMTPQEMSQICQAIGASYVIAFTPATVTALQAAGFQAVAEVDLGPLEQFRKVVRTPAVRLTLLRNPSPVTVIEPVVRWERKGNVLTWEAKAGQSYVVRYRYSPDFQAHQNGQVLGIEPVHPIGGISLTFMRVHAIADGPLQLKFHPRWI